MNSHVSVPAQTNTPMVGTNTTCTSPDSPDVITVAPLDNEYVLTLSIPSNLSFFRGHFPTSPILPGVVQVHWAAQFAQRYWTFPGVFQQLKQLKFFNKIEPNMHVQLSLQRSPTGFQFSYSSQLPNGNLCRHSSGQFEWSEK